MSDPQSPDSAPVEERLSVWLPVDVPVDELLAARSVPAHCWVVSPDEAELVAVEVAVADELEG